MAEEATNAGAVEAPAAAQSQPEVYEAPAEVSAKAESDGWGESLAAFEEADESEYQPEPKAEPEANAQESESKSHFEQDKPQKDGDLNLEKLAVPHKFKERVKEFVTPLIEESHRKTEAATQQLGQYQEATQSMVDVFKDIAQNPAKLAEYVAQYGDKLGLPPEVVQNYSKFNSQRNGQRHQETPNAQVQTADSLLTKYANTLATATDPQQFVGTLGSLITDAMNLNKSEMTETFKQLLGGYHNEVVNPNLETFKQVRESAHHQAKVGSWNEAHTAVKTKYQDFGTYDAKVREVLTSDPILSRFKEALNSNPDALIAQGITHETLIERAYEQVSRADHIAKAKQPAPREWNGGLPPSGKHIKTNTVGGSDWDEIKSKLYD